MERRRSLSRPLVVALLFDPAICLCAVLSIAAGARGAIQTTPTMDGDVLAAALQPAGLSINSVVIRNGVAGQFGTFSNFDTLPVTIRPGIVLSSGDVTNLAPFEQPPGYNDPGSGSDPNVTSPPAQVNNWMNTQGDGNTPEFDAYGSTAGNIENFNGSYDVAALEVNFTLDNPSQIRFDFIFGSVEYWFYTSSFTDAFLVFLDGVAPENQITFDSNGNAVQVGSSFAGLETTADQNTAFSNPHGVIHHLTTTSKELSDGEHTLIFEVGDVNDHVLDSCAFITQLRAEAGHEGTDETEDDIPEPALLGVLLISEAVMRRRK